MKFKVGLNCFLFCFIVGFLSCTSVETGIADSEVYFDLSGAMDRLIAEQDANFSVEKTVSLNGKSEQKSIDSYDLSQELTILKKYDIDKVSLAGKYNVNVSQDNGFELTEYLANEDKLKTRILKVWKNADKIEKIEVEALLNSIMATSDQKIIYEPSRLFHMISKDENKYSNDLVKEILITY